MADILNFNRKKIKSDLTNDSHFNTLMLQKIMNHIYLQAKNNIDKGFKGELYDLVNVFCKTNKVDHSLNKRFQKEISDENQSFS
ncbi:MAG: hypothetical protein VXY34_03175 [Bdellovibrionota bacterium]|nr:hypothetical protein [Bdellovibrionota bacterium]MEC8623796.1 hypothetical protein [Bdellovibrionota bacterium]